MKSLLMSGLLLAAFSAPSAFGRSSEPARYRVTVANVTAGNVLSPFLAVVQPAGSSLFRVGEPSSEGLAALAETGNAQLLIAEVQGRGQNTFAQADGVLHAGEAKSVELTLAAQAFAAQPFIQIAAMIGRSNDSFVSAKSPRLDALPRGGKVSFEARNFDAGSEENTGLVADFGSGGHPTAGAEGRVSYDRGLNARGDAPEAWGWGPVAAIVTIERL